MLLHLLALEVVYCNHLAVAVNCKDGEKQDVALILKTNPDGLRNSPMILGCLLGRCRTYTDTCGFAWAKLITRVSIYSLKKREHLFKQTFHHY